MNISSFKYFEQKQDYAVFVGHRFDKQISESCEFLYSKGYISTRCSLFFILIHDHQVSHKLVEFMLLDCCYQKCVVIFQFNLLNFTNLTNVA